MLKFFRRIRRKLLIRGSFRKYLVYAIGEIVLVVIGIVIALQLNNWNENRKTDQAFEELFDAFEEDLYEVIAETTNLIHSDYNTKEQIELVLAGEASREMYENGSIRPDLIRPSRLDISDGDIKVLLEAQQEFPWAYKRLIPQLKQYLKVIERQQLEERMKLSSHQRHMDHLIQQVDTLSYPDTNRSPLSSLLMDYYINDPSYLSHLRGHGAPLQANLRNTIGVRASALVLLVQLKQIREGFNEDDITRLMKDLGMVPFRPLSCQDTVPIQDRTFFGSATYFPIVNGLKEEVSLFRLNTQGERMGSISIKAEEMTTNFGKITQKGELRVQEGTMIEWDKAGDCVQRFQVQRNGFLVLQ